MENSLVNPSQRVEGSRPLRSSVNTTVRETSELRVFPNPANESFQIELRKEKFSIQIFDMTGKMVYQKNDVDEITTICNDRLGEGIYTIRINTVNGKNIFRRLAVTR